MSEQVPPAAVPNDVPLARVERSESTKATKFVSRLWLLTLVCLVVAIYSVFSMLSAKGPVILVRFEQGHGIKPGDALRYRGIDVGQVKTVEVDDDLNGVQLEIELMGQSAGLACEGSEFWIQRPRLSLARLAGLDTVVGAKYVGVEPGDPAAPPAREFIGLETPLAITGVDATDVVVHFAQGHSLEVGSDIKHRGIVIGEVTAVDMEDDYSGVRVGVRLTGSGQQVAREGSRFWIEHPTLNAAEIRGLETIVAGPFLAVQPGPRDARPCFEFEGLQTPPTGDLPAGGLEITLEAPQLGGLNRGAAVTYRGTKVGRIAAVGLATDAATVEARAIILPPYRSLVRTNSKFWSTSGFELQVGFGGVKLDAESLASIAVGGVAFATDNPPGRPITTGHVFRLHEEAEPDWLAWKPRIPVGSHTLPNDAALPQPLRAAARWQVSTLGITSDKQRQGWLLLTENNHLLGPKSILNPLIQAADDAVMLGVAGKQFALTSSAVQIFNRIALFRPQESLVGSRPAWPMHRIRHASSPEDCIIIAATPTSIVPISASRLTPDKQAWLVDPSLALDPNDYHGACVVSLADGDLVGLVDFDEGRLRVELIPAEVRQGVAVR